MTTIVSDPAGSRRSVLGHSADRLSKAFCGAVACVAITVLIGWATEIELLKTVLPGLTTMKPNTALGLLATSFGLWQMPLQSTAKPFLASQLSLGAGVFVLALGLATSAEYLFGLQLRIDELLFADPATTSAPYNGRMSPATAIAFVSLGTGIVLLALGKSRSILAAHCLAFPAAALGALSLVGYAYGVEHLYNFGPYVSVALNTALSLCALSAAVLLSHPDEGWRRPLVGRPAARAVLARLLPWSLLVPFLIGLLVLAGVHAGFYQALCVGR